MASYINMLENTEVHLRQRFDEATSLLASKDERIAELERQLAKMRHDNEMLTSGGIVEVAVRNINVRHYGPT